MTKKWVFIKPGVEPGILDAALSLWLGTEYTGIEVGEDQLIVEVSKNVSQEQIDSIIEQSESDLHAFIAYNARKQMMEQLDTVNTIKEMKTFLIEWLIPLEE